MTNEPKPKTDGSGRMFDAIATRYDLLNRLISLGLDKGWRRQLESQMPADGRILDAATGTADVAISMAERAGGRRVVGLDPSAQMLRVAAKKLESRSLTGQVDLMEGDAQRMNFDDDSFCGATMAFGIRNVPDRLQALRELKRVVAPGGPVAILELAEPSSGWLAPFARFHMHHVVPMLGALLSGRREYRYLQTSVSAFPPPEDFMKLMGSAGLRDLAVTRLSFGVAHLYLGHV